MNTANIVYDNVIGVFIDLFIYYDHVFFYIGLELFNYFLLVGTLEI